MTDSAHNLESEARGVPESPLLKAALAIAKLGFPVFPVHGVTDAAACTCGDQACERIGKHPRTAHGFKDATTDEAQIRRWWREMPDSNVGIATDRLYILDRDPRHGGDGSLSQLEARHGTLPATVTVLTGGGGGHYYFLPRPGQKACCRIGFLPGLDVRATGGYVVAPPSRHESGGRYQWMPGRGPGEVEIALAPQWLIDEANGARQESSQVQARPVRPSAGRVRQGDPENDGLMRRALAYAQQVSLVSKGQRNSTVFSLAGHIAALVDEHGACLGESSIFDVVAGWNARLSEPLRDDELAKAVHSALHNGTPREPKRPRRKGRGSHSSSSPGQGSGTSVEGATDEEGACVLGREEIIYSQPGGQTPMHELTAKALEAIATRCPDRLYVRGQKLVRATCEQEPSDDGIQRSDAMRITLAQNAIVGEILGEAVKWTKLVKRKEDGELAPVETWCPLPVERAFCARGEWTLLRPLLGVVESPTMRPDGSILDQPGYDPSTALVFHPLLDYSPVPVAPTREQAREAARILLEPFAEFPFETEYDRASLLALMLTIAGRSSIVGHVPFWLVLASCFRAGKGLLAVCAVLAMTGRLPDLLPPTGGRASDAESEMRKRISTILLEAARVAIIDNVADGSTLRSEALASVLTADTWTDRKLGGNESVRLPARTVWAATGVNVSLWGDLAGRALSVRIDPGVESPESRTFSIVDLRAHVRREHPRLLVAALTLLRAHDVAGAPGHGMPLLGDYEAWDKRIRAAVIWATGVDPLATQARLKADAPDGEELACLFTAWWAQFRGSAHSVRQVRHLAGSELVDAIADAGCADKHGRPDTGALGRLLRTAKGRIVAGFKLLDRPGRGGTKVWWLTHLEGAGSASTPNSAPEGGVGRGTDGGDGGDGGSPAGGTHARARAHAHAGSHSGTPATAQPSQPSQPDSHPGQLNREGTQRG